MIPAETLKATFPDARAGEPARRARRAGSARRPSSTACCTSGCSASRRAGPCAWWRSPRPGAARGAPPPPPTWRSPPRRRAGRWCWSRRTCADRRSPGLLGLAPRAGLAEVLDGTAELGQAVVRVGPLSVLCAGRPRDPAAVLRARAPRR